MRQRLRASMHMVSHDEISWSSCTKVGASVSALSCPPEERMATLIRSGEDRSSLSRVARAVPVPISTQPKGGPLPAHRRGALGLSPGSQPQSTWPDVVSMRVLQVIHGYPMRYNAGSEVYTQGLSQVLAGRVGIEPVPGALRSPVLYFRLTLAAGAGGGGGPLLWSTGRPGRRAPAAVTPPGPPPRTGRCRGGECRWNRRRGTGSPPAGTAGTAGGPPGPPRDRAGARAVGLFLLVHVVTSGAGLGAFWAWVICPIIPLWYQGNE